jgi:twitching motility protein PilT
VGGGRVAAFELMGSNLRVKDVVVHGESEGKTFYEIIEGNQPFGMMTFDQCIADLFKNSVITEETAMSYASRKSQVGRALDSIKSARGEKTTTIEDLALDTDYGKKGKK